MLLSVGATGCSTITQQISGIPADRLPPQFFAEEKNNLVPIDISLLGQERPRQYILDKGDVLGIYIDRVLPFTEPDAVPVMPPVTFRPTRVLCHHRQVFRLPCWKTEQISLPLLRPIKVKGFDARSTRDLIASRTSKRRILMEDGNPIRKSLVTQIR